MERLIRGTLAVLAAFVLVGTSAAVAQEGPADCYPIPEDGCPDVGGADGEVGADDGAVDTDDGEVLSGAEDQAPTVEVLSVVETRSLARTGVTVAGLLAVAAAALLLGFGLLRSRRRTTT